MNLVITAPFGIALDAADVASIRAEDPTGSFGIQRGHIPFVTVLRVGVLSYRVASGETRCVGLRGGVLVVDEHGDVHIATPEAVCAKDLDTLERDVLEGLRARAALDEASRAAAHRLERTAIREVRRYLDPERSRPAVPEPMERGDGGD